MCNITVSGSWGELTVDKFTGCVLGYDDQGNLDENDESERGYLDITVIDLAEWRRTYDKEPDHLDILDVGFWAGDEYEAPLHEWRAENRGIDLDRAAQAAMEG